MSTLSVCVCVYVYECDICLSSQTPKTLLIIILMEHASHIRKYTQMAMTRQVVIHYTLLAALWTSVNLVG